MTPTARTLAELRAQGWLAGVVEKFVRFPPPGHRVDLFGFLDILAVTEGRVLGIQACAGASHAARAKKIMEHENLARVLASGIEIQVWSWAKQGARGKRKVWTYRVEEIRQ